MNGTHKVGRQGGWRASLKHGLAAALLVMLLSQGDALAGPHKIVSPAATDVMAAIGSSVQGLIDAGAGFVRDLHELYKITQLRKMSAANDATAAPALEPARWLRLCKAKAAPALPAMDKTRS
jgi:hypothetical protein